MGFVDPRVVASKPITIENRELEEKVKGYKFYSITYRLFKISQLEVCSEDYGQTVCYNGQVQTSPDSFVLDCHHIFPKGKVVAVSGNTYRMLRETRFNQYFEFNGDFSKHYGLYNSEKLASFPVKSQKENNSGCC